MERCLLTLEQWSPAFMAQEPVSWKTVFPRTRSREDGLGMIQADYIYCALCFESNAAANLTGGIDLWPRDWGHLLESIRGQVNSLSNCLQSAWRMGEGAGVLPTRPPPPLQVHFLRSRLQWEAQHLCTWCGVCWACGRQLHPDSTSQSPIPS